MREIKEIGGLKIETVWKDLVTTVTISDAFLSATGNAKWFTTDTYNAEVGKSIAYARALSRWARKTEKRIIRGLSA